MTPLMCVINQLLMTHTLLHKIIYNHVDVLLPSYVSRHTRSNALKFIQIGSTIDAYKYSFFPCTIPLWNSLPEDIM